MHALILLSRVNAGFALVSEIEPIISNFNLIHRLDLPRRLVEAHLRALADEEG